MPAGTQSGLIELGSLQELNKDYLILGVGHCDDLSYRFRTPGGAITDCKGLTPASLERLAQEASYGGFRQATHVYVSEIRHASRVKSSGIVDVWSTTEDVLESTILYCKRRNKSD